MTYSKFLLVLAITCLGLAAALCFQLYVDVQVLVEVSSGAGVICGGSSHDPSCASLIDSGATLSNVVLSRVGVLLMVLAGAFLIFVGCAVFGFFKQRGD